MARSAGDPRVRYIGFRLHTERPVDRKALIEAIRRTGRRFEGAEAAAPWLTRYDGTLGVVRCIHAGVAVTRKILDAIEEVPVDGASVPVRVETLATSGTIRTLTEGPLKELKDTGKRR